MITNTVHLTFSSLVLGAFLFVIPIYMLYVCKVGICKKAIKSLLLMLAGIIAAALLAGMALWASNIAVTLLCTLVYVTAAAVYMVVKSRIGLRNYLIPTLLGMVLAVLPLSIIFVWLVLGLSPLAPQYLLPVVTIVTGAVAGSNAKAMSAYGDGLRYHNRLYYYLIGNGATRREAAYYFTRRAMKKSLLPLLQRMGVMSMGTAPVTMWVMIFCGFSISQAAMVQILLIGLLVSASTAMLALTLFLAHRYSFDSYDKIKNNL